MATVTPYLDLKKPDSTDFFNIKDFNDNADVVDQKIKDIETNGVKADGGNSNTLTVTDLGHFSGRTVGELRAALNAWLQTNAGKGSMCCFQGAWVTAWNSGNESTVITDGTRWTVSQIAVFYPNDSCYTKLLICDYTNGAGIYTVARTFNAWQLAANLRDAVTLGGKSGIDINYQIDNYKVGSTLPQDYPVGETIFFSNNPASQFNAMAYCTVHTIKGYNGTACIQYLYPYNVNIGNVYYRTAGYNSNVWGEWKTLAVSSIESVMNGDANTFINGKVYAYTGCINVPANYCIVDTNVSGAEGYQLATLVTSGLIYKRTKTSSGWTEWKDISNGGNASMVDGYHISALSESAYNALVTKDSSTLYFIT